MRSTAVLSVLLVCACASEPDLAGPAAAPTTATKKIDAARLRQLLGARFEDCERGRFLDCMVASQPLENEPYDCHALGAGEPPSWAKAKPGEVFFVMQRQASLLVFGVDTIELAIGSGVGRDGMRVELAELNRAKTVLTGVLGDPLPGDAPARQWIASFTRGCFVDAQLMAWRAERSVDQRIATVIASLQQADRKEWDAGVRTRCAATWNPSTCEEAADYITDEMRAACREACALIAQKAADDTFAHAVATCVGASLECSRPERCALSSPKDAMVRVESRAAECDSTCATRVKLARTAAGDITKYKRCMLAVDRTRQADHYAAYHRCRAANRCDAIEQAGVGACTYSP